MLWIKPHFNFAVDLKHEQSRLHFVSYERLIYCHGFFIDHLHPFIHRLLHKQQVLVCVKHYLKMAQQSKCSDKLTDRWLLSSHLAWSPGTATNKIYKRSSVIIATRRGKQKLHEDFSEAQKPTWLLNNKKRNTLHHTLHDVWLHMCVWVSSAK